MDSLYGSNGHLKNPEHIKYQEQWGKDNFDENKIEELDNTMKKVKLFEYEFCAMLIQLNLPFTSTEPLLDFIKKYSHSSAVQECSLNRFKAPEIIKSEIEPFFTNQIREKLKNNFFSLIIDEATDISKKKFMAVMVQYVDDVYGTVCKLLALKECSQDATSESLYSIIQTEILNQELSHNLIALVSDGAKVMNGAHNSLLQKIKTSHPYIWCLYCICHCLHLTASKASEQFPEFVLEFVSKAYQLFSYSPKRIATFANIQEKMNFKVKKILRAGKTRWLSLEAAIKRLLDLWDPLEAYYKEDPKENVLLKPIENKVIKIYLQFLSIFLEKVNSVNQYFQREVSEVFEIKNQLMKVFTGFSNHIFKPSIKVKDEIKLVDPVTRFNLNLNQNIDEYLLTPREMFEHFKLVFKNVIDIDILEEKDQKTVCKDFQKFILQILKGLKKYLPF